MEDRLQRLVTAGDDENRLAWAREWKREGGKVIGLDGTYIPEEMIYAAGILPWRLIGAERANTSLAAVYLPSNFDRYCAHVLESVLSGEFDFLDGAVISDFADDTRRLGDVLVHTRRPPFVYRLHVPSQDSQVAIQKFRENLASLRWTLERLAGVRIFDENLREAIILFNKMRTFLNHVYEQRKREVPPITGAEAVGITIAAMVMPKKRYIQELEALLPYIEERRIPSEKFQRRLLISSDRLYARAYLQLIEETGALIAMDDLDTGSRYFSKSVETEGDPLYALAVRYLSQPETRMPFWDRHVNQVLEWVRDFKIAGVINFPQVYDFSRLLAVPFFNDRLKAAGIPNITLTRNYFLCNTGRLRTEVEAFLEMLN